METTFDNVKSENNGNTKRVGLTFDIDEHFKERIDFNIEKKCYRRRNEQGRELNKIIGPSIGKQGGMWTPSIQTKRAGIQVERFKERDLSQSWSSDRSRRSLCMCSEWNLSEAVGLVDNYFCRS